MTLMKEVCEYLDKEYVKHNLLGVNSITNLHTFQLSKAATTDEARFEKLYQIWVEVANNLKKINLEESLNNPQTLQMFQAKMPSSFLKKYIILKQSSIMKGKKLHRIMDEFMDKEREHHKEMQ